MADPRQDDSTTDAPEGPLAAQSPHSTLPFSGAHASLVGQRVGRYQIRRIIATGGMGTVYEAVQHSPRRTVALKVMKHGIASKSALRRFEYESQILARLRHPGIAQVYEAGVHEEEGSPALRAGSSHGSESRATPYFAMEYIPNAKPITQYARDKKLGTRERLELFAKVCEAVHHGHQKGIIHRDLKPGNILVDSHGQPKVIDFGVARATDSDLAVTTLQTDVGQLIGTLQYMSPEQCDADPHDLDTRSDVYALGVVLYELICEQLPYEVSKVAVYEAARVIREVNPPRPSSFNKTLRGDVETIALKALEKERERRYQSALDLSQDITRYLRGEAIMARPPSLVYQLRMLSKQHRTKFLGGIALGIGLVLGVAATFGVAAAFVLYEEWQEESWAKRHGWEMSAWSEFFTVIFDMPDTIPVESFRVARDTVRERHGDDELPNRVVVLLNAIASGEHEPLPNLSVDDADRCLAMLVAMRRQRDAINEKWSDVAAELLTWREDPLPKDLAALLTEAAALIEGHEE